MQMPEMSDKPQDYNVSHADAFRHACCSLLESMANELSALTHPLHGMPAPLAKM